MAESTDRRRSIADRNVTAILDAAEQLIAARAPVTIAGVASAAGVSRVTVYAHFPTSEALLEAVVERAVGHAAGALAAARPGEGRPDEALERLLASGWQELGRHADMADAASAMLPAAAMTRSHAVAHATVAELLQRGQKDGTFRSDLPVSWLVTCCFALIHGCRTEVTAGRLAEDDAERVLASTIMDLILRRLPGREAVRRYSLTATRKDQHEQRRGVLPRRRRHPDPGVLRHQPVGKGAARAADRRPDGAGGGAGARRNPRTGLRPPDRRPVPFGAARAG